MGPIQEIHGETCWLEVWTLDKIALSAPHARHSLGLAVRVPLAPQRRHRHACRKACISGAMCSRWGGHASST